MRLEGLAVLQDHLASAVHFLDQSQLLEDFPLLLLLFDLEALGDVLGDGAEDGLVVDVVGEPVVLAEFLVGLPHLDRRRLTHASIEELSVAIESNIMLSDGCIIITSALRMQTRAGDHEINELCHQLRQH